MSTKTPKKVEKVEKSEKKIAKEEADVPTYLYDEEPFFALLDMYFERNKSVLVEHHISAYNQFIEEVIPSIVQGGENIISEKISENKVIRYRLKFENLAINPPSIESTNELLYPIHAIQKNLTYSSVYTATVTQYQDIIDIASGNIETKIIDEPSRNVPIAKIPIMVGSKYCNLNLRPSPQSKHCKYDSGGYFIVNGSEKVVLSVETMIPRKPLVFAKKDQNTLIYYCQAQSRPDTQFVGNVQMFTIKLKKDYSVVVSIPVFKEISVYVLLRALGFEKDEDIVNIILDKNKDTEMYNLLMISMNSTGVGSKKGPSSNMPDKSNNVLTQEEAIELLMKNMRSTKTYSDTSDEIREQQKRKHLMRILTQLILPHQTSGTGNPTLDMRSKALYIAAKMIRQLLKCYLNGFQKESENSKGCDDRDAMTNKRIDLIGILLGGLTEQHFKKMLNDCNKVFKSKGVDDKKPPNIIKHIKPNPIEQGLRQALSTGAFGSQSRKGLSQMLNRMNYLHTLSSLRRVISPTVDASTNKMTSPRHLHPTQYGAMCPLETPEGPVSLILELENNVPKLLKKSG